MQADSSQPAQACSLQEAKELQALLQQAERDSVPVSLLFLADGAVVRLSMPYAYSPASPISQLHLLGLISPQLTWLPHTH